MSFVHLHNHTQYSLLDGACRVDRIIATAKSQGMNSVAITDHGNMFGAIDFYNKAKKEGIKPLLGTEAYIFNGEYEDQNVKGTKRYHLVLIAATLQGYKNLIKLSSHSFIDGYYYKPRMSKADLKEHSEGIIALSACIQGEIARNYLDGYPERAEKALHDYKDIFGNNFYIELQDHGLAAEKEVMPKLIQLAKKTNTPLVVTNDCHYINKEDAEAHDILLCMQTGKRYDDPDRMRYETQDLYFKTEAEMRCLFPEVPEAYDNTQKIADSINFELDYDKFLLPKIDVPKQHKDMEHYLRFLCEEGVKRKYNEITQEVTDRMNFELNIIHTMGYDGYFLVVKDFIDAARDMNIPVGPGRGSAAGSIVAYALDITKLDPLKYGLLFERFLDLKRVGMPDIDTDICAQGRDKVIDYVVKKYGRESVTQIITYGKLQAKVILKDVGRVLGVEPAETNKMTKLIPGMVKNLDEALKEYPDFKLFMESNETYKKILRIGKTLEGLIRQTGIHACGVVIGPDDLSNYVPLGVSIQKNGEKSVLVQYESKFLDDLKLLKMDFLGLKTLTIIKKCLEYVKDNYDVTIDMDNVDLTDKKTFQLLSKGQTDGVFQFESPGMKKYLMKLQPDVFEDLIAMVALYRPGPMQFIDSFINRKHGVEKIEYDHDLTKNSLKETYGVTVYQEQVMQISKDLGKFSSADAGVLRKAISKKKLDMMEKMYVQFEKGAMENGCSQNTVKKIWDGWLEFAKYAFNKSHAACYAFVSFQTAYLKAHYPVEFMASILSLEEDPAKIPFFIETCKAMNIEVLPPNINESYREFKVKDNKILFGLKGIKNVGEAAIREIIEERENNGPYSTLFDLSKRLKTSAINKTTLEYLILSGTLDPLSGNRAQKWESIADAVDFSSSQQKNKDQMTFFDLLDDDKEEEEFYPKLKDIDDWDDKKKLENEKKALGFYISGHPLNQYKEFIKHKVNCYSDFLEKGAYIPKKIKIVGIVTLLTKKRTKKGDFFGIVSMEDLHGKFEISLHKERYNEIFNNLQEGSSYLVQGTHNTYSSEDKILRINPTSVVDFEDIVKETEGNFVVEIRKNDIDKLEKANYIQIIEKNKGNFKLEFNIEMDETFEILVESQKYKVNPTSKFCEYWKDLDLICYTEMKR